MQADREIRNWARSRWFRENWIRWAVVLWLSLVWGAFLHASGTFVAVHLQWWFPTFDQFIRAGIGITVGAAIFGFFFAWPGSFPSFLRELDRRMGLHDQLTTWHEIGGSDSGGLQNLLSQKLWLGVSATPVPASRSQKRRWPFYMLAVALVLDLLLWLPWGGGESFASQARRQMIQAQLHMTIVEDGGEVGAESGPGESSQSGSSAPAEGKGSQSSNPSEAPEQKPPKQKFEIVPKFTPALQQEGPKTLKEVFLYDLPASTVSASQSAEARMDSQKKYEEFRRQAEQWVQKENLDPEEKKLVLEYFEKIRP